MNEPVRDRVDESSKLLNATPCASPRILRPIVFRIFIASRISRPAPMAPSGGIGLGSGRLGSAPICPSLGARATRDDRWCAASFAAPRYGFRSAPRARPKLCAHSIDTLSGRMAGLDVIITVDTMTAPLAGALGLNVWTLLAGPGLDRPRPPPIRNPRLAGRPETSGLRFGVPAAQ
jgi:hypothetical protein